MLSVRCEPMMNRSRSCDRELQRRRCKTPRVAQCVLRIKNSSTYFEKHTSLLKCWCCSCKFRCRTIGSICVHISHNFKIVLLIDLQYVTPYFPLPWYRNRSESLLRVTSHKWQKTEESNVNWKSGLSKKWPPWQLKSKVKQTRLFEWLA
jgi:hypothetical protein